MGLFFAAAALLAFYILLRRLQARPDASEPPLIPSKIPLVGHLVGLIWHGLPYYTLQSVKHNIPIFTINLVTNKSYVITSPNLVAGIQRKSRLISFDPFPTSAAERLAGITGSGLQLLRETRAGGHGLGLNVLHAMGPALLGDGLDRMNINMVMTLKSSIDELGSTGAYIPFDLYAWCRQALTIASTEAVYGPLNPYKSGFIQEAFWRFERNTAIFLLGVSPRLTAPGAWKSREMVVAALEQYYRMKGQEHSSELTYRRWQVQQENGASVADIARLEALLAFALLPNTIPAGFWLLIEIYSRPHLLAEIREELCNNALHVDKNGVHSIDLGDIQSKCDIFVSTLQETLRMHSNATVTRKLYEDIMLNEYLLKAGSLVQVPAHELNRHNSVWLTNPERFDAKRFMKRNGSKSAPAATGYLSFGASPNICPGRHFATGEILAMTAMILLRYDIEPENGCWDISLLDTRDLPATITPPEMGSFGAFIAPRTRYHGFEWQFQVSKGQGKYGLITG